MKQVIISFVVILLAAGIFGGMVLYTIATLRTVQMQLLTGEEIAMVMG